ncbi:ribosome-associated translation inhibitor RaiA [Rickettsiales bacterium]|nr:ribosome-associated translation inhibitor RaiA [Rickettsiales bacterium]
MQISITGKHIELGQSLKDHVEEVLNDSVKKYFSRAVSADVSFSKVKSFFKVNIVVNEGTGNHIVIKSKAEDPDIYAAFDKAVAKVAKQLRRYNRKIKNHNHVNIDKDIENAMRATHYTLSSNDDSEDEVGDNDAPLVIAEKVTIIEEISVSDAVMRMDLGELPALMFRNKKTGNINVIYRRSDGNISWIDPGELAADVA